MHSPRYRNERERKGIEQNRSITKMKLSIREKWNCSRARIQPTIVLFMSAIECNDSWNFRSFYRFAVVFISMIDMLLLFFQILHMKPWMLILSFVDQIHCYWHLVWCDIYGCVFAIVFGNDEQFWFTCKSNLKNTLCLPCFVFIQFWSFKYGFATNYDGTHMLPTNVLLKLNKKKTSLDKNNQNSFSHIFLLLNVNCVVVKWLKCTVCVLSDSER